MPKLFRNEEKGTEINKYKRKNKELSNQLLKIYKEQDNYNARIEKKDKMIDLMAKQLYIEGFCREFKCTKCNREPKQCTKQYFERKAEKE